jgi:hypothetical protein
VTLWKLWYAAGLLRAARRFVRAETGTVRPWAAVTSFREAVLQTVSADEIRAARSHCLKYQIAMVGAAFTVLSMDVVRESISTRWFILIVFAIDCIGLYGYVPALRIVVRVMRSMETRRRGQ